MSTGKLIIIGGAEDKEKKCTILRTFLHFAGGRQAEIAVLTAATQQPQQVGAVYREVFMRLGASSCMVVHVGTREDAIGPQLSSILKQASGIFITGGDQLRITATIGGTELYKAIHYAYKEGIVIGGTSAGASVMSEVMIIGGEDDTSPKRYAVRMAPGLGLLRGIVIDQHFAERGRLGRLLAVVAHNPHILGIGVDEDTALVVDPTTGMVEVIGKGAATFVDGKEIYFSNISNTMPDDVLAVANCKIHTLPAGYSFNLSTRLPVFPELEKEAYLK